jgi:hypothetical protein
VFLLFFVRTAAIERGSPAARIHSSKAGGTDCVKSCCGMPNALEPHHPGKRKAALRRLLGT